MAPNCRQLCDALMLRAADGRRLALTLIIVGLTATVTSRWAPNRRTRSPTSRWKR